jgi:type IV secretion system protein VirD4
MSMLKGMTAVSGFDPDEAAIAEEDPGSGRVTVTDTALTRSAAALGRGLVANGGAYAAAAGIGEAVCAVAGLNPMVDLLVVGACGAHATQRLWDGFTWHHQGGRAAARRRRAYQGEANPLEVMRTLSPAVAARKMKRLAPALPASRSYVSLGHTVHKPRQAVAVSRAETIAVIGVPQTIKTALTSHMVLEAPGPVLATSSRADQYRHTVTAREAMGEVHVLDADGFGPGTTLAWNPVAGCRVPAVAIRRAGDFMHASPRDAGGKDKFHEDRGAKLVRWALHAADLLGRDMYDVLDWVHGPDNEEFRKALRCEDAAPGWGSALESLLAQDEVSLSSAIVSAEAALGWMEDPELAAVACPRPGQGLDIAAFLRRGNGTVYLIGSEKPYGSLTPFFSAFATEFLEQARILAEQQGGRLRAPLTVVADEAATTAKIDFPRWCAVTAGYNITVIAGFQSISQIETGWGGAAATETILNLMSTKVIAGGVTSPADLERQSFLCGERPTWRREHGQRVYEKERTFPPERIRQLPEFNALVVHRSAKPVQVRISPVWEHPAHQEVTITDPPGQAAPASTEE